MTNQQDELPEDLREEFGLEFTFAWDESEASGLRVLTAYTRRYPQHGLALFDFAMWLLSEESDVVD